MVNVPSISGGHKNLDVDRFGANAAPGFQDVVLTPHTFGAVRAERFNCRPMNVEGIEQQDRSRRRVLTDLRVGAGRESLEDRTHTERLTRATLPNLEDDEVVAPVESNALAVSSL